MYSMGIGTDSERRSLQGASAAIRCIEDGANEGPFVPRGYDGDAHGQSFGWPIIPGQRHDGEIVAPGPDDLCADHVDGPQGDFGLSECVKTGRRDESRSYLRRCGTLRRSGHLVITEGDRDADRGARPDRQRLDGPDRERLGVRDPEQIDRFRRLLRPSRERD